MSIYIYIYIGICILYIGHGDHFIKVLEMVPREKNKQMKPKKDFENL